jgi:hypothetical protein
MAINFKGAHFPQEVILMGVRWYVPYPLSTRHVEELMEERGVEVDHWFCQLVAVETLIERTDSVPCPFLSFKQPTPCP